MTVSEYFWAVLQRSIVSYEGFQLSDPVRRFLTIEEGLRII